MKKRILAGIFLAIICTGPAAVFAQTGELPANEEDIIIQDQETAIPQGNGGLSGFGAWDIIRMVIILGCVIAAIYGIFYVIKKAGGPRFQNNDLIRIHASQALSSNTSVHLLEVGRELFLVGSAENNVQLIAPIQEKETADEIRLRLAAAGPAARKSFQEVLSGLFKGNSNGEMDDYRHPEDFLSKQRERLKNL